MTRTTAKLFRHDAVEAFARRGLGATIGAHHRPGALAALLLLLPVAGLTAIAVAGKYQPRMTVSGRIITGSGEVEVDAAQVVLARAADARRLRRTRKSTLGVRNAVPARLARAKIRTIRPTSKSSVCRATPRSSGILMWSPIAGDRAYQNGLAVLSWSELARRRVCRKRPGTRRRGARSDSSRRSAPTARRNDHTLVGHRSRGPM